MPSYARGVGKAILIALATLLIDLLLLAPAPAWDPWSVQACSEERPIIPDGLQTLRGLGRITMARLRTNARKLAQIIARATRTLVSAPFTLGEFA